MACSSCLPTARSGAFWTGRDCIMESCMAAPLLMTSWITGMMQNLLCVDRTGVRAAPA